MKKIKLKSIALTNFKGIESLKIGFGSITDIEGDNATGKTTIADAFNWCLFGADSHGSAKFNIKKLDANGNVIHELDHSVKLVMEIDDVIYTIQRTYRENWTQSRSSGKRVLKGHNTEYEINGEPLKPNEFTAAISQMIDKDKFQLITDPRYFNNQLHWTDRRQILIDLVGDIEINDDWINGIINQGKTITGYRKELVKKIETLEKERDDIPVRIDELNQSMGEKKDVGELKGKLAECKDKVVDYKESISALQSKDNDKLKTQYNLELSKWNSHKSERINKISSDIMETERRIRELDHDISSANGMINDAKQSIGRYEKEKENLSKEFDKLTSLESTSCPTCNRPYSEEHHQKAINKRLQTINDEGIQITGKINNLQKQIKVQEGYLSSYKSNKDDLQERKENLIQVKKGIDNENLPDNILSLKEQIENESSLVDHDQILDLEKLIEIEEATIRTINNAIASDVQRNSLLKRVNDYNTRLKNVSNDISVEYGKLNRIDDYRKKRIRAIENKVNSLFFNVEFKLFSQTLSGEDKEMCEVTVNGVPYSDVNTAGKLNAGLEVIKALQDHYQLSGPIFIDNRESISEIVNMDCQIVNLIKVTNQKELKWKIK